MIDAPSDFKYALANSSRIEFVIAALTGRIVDFSVDLFSEVFMIVVLDAVSVLEVVVAE